MLDDTDDDYLYDSDVSSDSLENDTENSKSILLSRDEVSKILNTNEPERTEVDTLCDDMGSDSDCSVSSIESDDSDSDYSGANVHVGNSMRGQGSGHGRGRGRGGSA